MDYDVNAALARAREQAASLLETLAEIADNCGSTDATRTVRVAGGTIMDQVAALRRIPRDVANARRPKGPAVAMRWTGHRYDGRNECTFEALRRTKDRVLLLTEYGGPKWWNIAKGEEVGAVTSVASGQVRGWRNSVDRWILSPEGREAVLAMPVGENDVSRAWDAMPPMDG